MTTRSTVAHTAPNRPAWWASTTASERSPGAPGSVVQLLQRFGRQRQQYPERDVTRAPVGRRLAEDRQQGVEIRAIGLAPLAGVLDLQQVARCRQPRQVAEAVEIGRAHV